MKEYMEKLINENRDEVYRLKYRISNLLVELEKQNEVIEEMQRHTGRDENIFSPRTANAINEESLKLEKSKSDSIKQEIEYVSGKIERLFEKQKEYEKVLGEINDKQINSKETEDEKAETKEIGNKEIGSDASDINNIDEMVTSNHMVSETLSERNIKLAETLSGVLQSVDIALALLNGDKNKCKNELKKIKRTLKMCIEEIK